MLSINEYVARLYDIMTAISMKQWPVEFDRTTAAIAILQEVGKDARTPGAREKEEKELPQPKPMTQKQHDFLHKYEITHEDTWTISQASNAIAAKIKEWG